MKFLCFSATLLAVAVASDCRGSSCPNPYLRNPKLPKTQRQDCSDGSCEWGPDTRKKTVDCRQGGACDIRPVDSQCTGGSCKPQYTQQTCAGGNCGGYDYNAHKAYYDYYYGQQQAQYNQPQQAYGGYNPYQSYYQQYYKYYGR